MGTAVAAVIAGVKAAVVAWGTFAAAHPIIAAGIKLAISVGLGMLGTQPDIPRPEAGRINIRQTRPARRRGVGRARAAGAYVRAVVIKDILHRVLVLPEGEVAIGRSWSHDDELKIVGGVVQEYRDKRYYTGHFRVETRSGFTGQTAYAGLVAADPGWTAEHRGEGVPSAWISNRSGSLKDFGITWPMGAGEYNREAFYGAYDWRQDSTAGGSGAQRRDDPETWTHTRNWVVWFANVLWFDYGQDWDRRIAPNLALLTAEADLCDEPVARAYYSGVLTDEVDVGAMVLPLNTVAGLAIGSLLTLSGQTYTVASIAGLNVTLTGAVSGDHAIGERASWAVHASAPVTEPRYEIGFWFERTTPLKDIIRTFVAATNGYFCVDRRGAFVIRCGHYEAPTVIFGEQELQDWVFEPAPLPDEIVNVLTLSFTDPHAAYLTADTDPWVNEDSVEIWGEKSKDFSPVGVQSNSQVRRVGLTLLDLLNAPTGMVRTPLAARRAAGERFVGIRNPECEDLFDAVVEMVEYGYQFETSSMLWSYRVVTPDMFRDGAAWDPEVHEGVGPVSGGQGGTVVETAPTIDSITVFFESTGAGGNGPRLHIEGSGPDRSDLTWFVQTRVTGATSWSVQEITDTDPAANFEGDSSFVPAVASLDVQLGYKTGGGNLKWSTTTPKDTTPRPAAYIDFDFLAGVYRSGVVASNRITDLSAWGFSRALAGFARTSTGPLTSFATGVARTTDLGLLYEAAATNLTLQSQTFDNAAWTKGAVTVTPNTTAAPDGTTTGDTLSLTAGAAVHQIYETTGSSVTLGNVLTHSWYVKMGTHRYVQLVMVPAAFGSAVYANFDLQTGAVGTTGGGASATITSAGGGWYRITLTATATATATCFAYLIPVTGASAAFAQSWTAAGTETVILWGAQREIGAATSYITTTSGTVTRPADAATVTLPTGTGTDEITVEWDSGSQTFARSTLGTPGVLNLTTDGAHAWIGHFIERVTVQPV